MSTSARALVLLGLLGSLLAPPAGVPAASAARCQPESTGSYRYTTIEFRAIFRLVLCRNVKRMPFGVTVSRQEGDEGVVGVGDGVARCRRRVCRASAVLQHPDVETAWYVADVAWGNGVSARLGPFTCTSTPAVASCVPLAGLSAP